MKKISKKDLQGLRRLFPVLEKEEMRRCVGGNSGGYYGDDWLNHGFGSYDPDGNFHWYGGYTQDEFDNWEGPWYGGWVYGMGYIWADINVYPYSGNGSFGYEGIGYEGYGYGGYGYGSDGNSNKRGDIIDADWACMFNCMNFLDSSKSAQEYYEYFTALCRVDAFEEGGLSADDRGNALDVCGFSYEEVNTVFYDGVSGVKQLVVFDMDDTQGRTHAGIVTGKTEGGYTIIYDPTAQRSYEVNFARIATVYRVKKNN